MRSSEIRKKFLEFFKSKGHAIIPSSSLVPSETDPTALFTTAGMHPLVPYLLGSEHPGGRRVVNIQKCVRTGDIDEVGDARHLTFFEMMGNWSFGDPKTADGVGAGYFKKEAIELRLEFLTHKNCLGLDNTRLAISVFAGANALPALPTGQAGGRQAQPFDEETFDLWKKLGVPEKRIAKLPKKNNWWGPAGQTGPCGPDTEMFYWIGGADKIPDSFNDNNDLWVEIWNDVFMQYNKGEDGKYYPLKQKNVDTGMGLERIAMVTQGKNNVYETDLFETIIKTLGGLTAKAVKPPSEENSIRIIADHIKASVFIIADEVALSNIGRGYVLRRLIRRAVRYGKLLGIEANFLAKVAEPVFEIYKEFYPELIQKKKMILSELTAEESRFNKTLKKGLKQFEDMLQKGDISGKDAFVLFSTYGFPLEMTIEMAKEKGGSADVKQFNEEFKKHQHLSKTASAGMFKGGLADAGEKTTKYHTAAHLLHQALKIVLGDSVNQKGSNITAERLRFDFSWPEKMTKEQVEKVEQIVNGKIKENLPVAWQEMNLEEARLSGAIGLFGHKYETKVKVYTVGDVAKGGQVFSKEICMGPHAVSTGELGRFKIVKEEAVSAGIRRIKAILE